MYLKVTRLASLVLTKLVFQLLCLQVLRFSRMQSRVNMVFQNIFSNLNGTLLPSEKLKHVISYLIRWLYKACTLYDFNMVIGKIRKIGQNKSFIYRVSFEYNNYDISEH